MRFLISLFVAWLLTVSVASAQTSTTSPVLYRVHAGDTEVSVAKKNHLSVAELRRLNHNLIIRKSHALKPGEELNVNPNTEEDFLGEYRWQFVGGDPAGPDLQPCYIGGNDSLLFRTIRQRLTEQLAIFNLPQEVKDGFYSQLEWQEPRIVNLYSSPETTLVIQGLIFGGFERTKLPNGKVVVSKLKYWDGNVACLWKDERTHKRLQTLPAAVYDGVKFNGYGYKLILFLGCQNGAFVKYELPPEVVEPTPAPPETIKVVAPCPPPETTTVYVTPPPPPETPHVAPPPAPKPNPQYMNRVVWLTPELSHIDPNGQPYDNRHGENIFTGGEITVLNGKQNVALRGRASEARFNLMTSNARAGDYNAGIVLIPLRTRNWLADFEVGPWYSAAERVHYVFSEPTPGDERWNPEKLTVDGFGLYARTQFLLPFRGYIDYKIRGRSKLLSENGGFITFRPGWLYLKAGADLQIRKDITRHVDGEISFPADTMSMSELRGGIIWSKRFLTYGSWQHWQYYSDKYYFTRFGPGGGFEWNFQKNTRLDGDVIRFRNFDDALWVENNRLKHHRAVNHEWRFKLGLVHTWPTDMHFWFSHK